MGDTSENKEMNQSKNISASVSLLMWMRAKQRSPRAFYLAPEVSERWEGWIRKTRIWTQMN